MPVYKVVCTPLSHFSMLYKADTIFGALCWAIRYKEGEERLQNILAQFRKSPPFLLSSMMPQGYLYKPLMHPVKIEPQNRNEIKSASAKKKMHEKIEAEKKKKRITFIPISLFKKYQTKFINIYNDEDLLKMPSDIVLGSFEITRNAIDRESLHAREGALFTELYMYTKALPLNFYIKVHDASYTKEWFQSMLSVVGINGLGKDCSVGKGSFSMTVNELTPDEASIFSHTSETFVSLSVCAGVNCNPVLHTTFTRYGKLGGMYSQCGIDGHLLYCKKPIVFYSEGSVFRGKENAGGLIHNIHSNPAIVQYGYAFPLYFNE